MLGPEGLSASSVDVSPREFSPAGDFDSGPKQPLSRLAGTARQNISSPRNLTLATTPSPNTSPTGAAIKQRRWSTLKGAYEYEASDGTRWDDRNLEAVYATH